MDIQTVKLDALMDAVYNPRVTLKPGDVEWERLKNSIEHFGYVEPIVVNKRGMVVVGGHQRLHVLRDMGVEQAEVVFVDLDENDEKALNVALNKISGKWDAEKLEEVMRELDIAGYDVSLAGFGHDELDSLYSGILEDGQKDLDEVAEEKSDAAELLNELSKEDDVSKIVENPRNVKHGDIWQLGNNRIICGDSYNEDTYKELVGDNKVAMVFTDPHYKYSSNKVYQDKAKEADRHFENGNNVVGRLVSHIAELGNTGMAEFECKKIEYLLKKDIPFVFFCCPKNGVSDYQKMISDNDYNFDIHVFGKNMCNPLRGGTGYMSNVEFIMLAFRGRIYNVDEKGSAFYRKYIEGDCEDTEKIEAWFRSAKYYGNGNSSTADAKECGLEKIEHATVKPQRLICQKIVPCSRVGEIVVDMFLGSGSTLIACEKLGRVCYGSEYSPEFVNLIIDRWEGFTGNKAVRIKEGAGSDD